MRDTETVPHVIKTQENANSGSVNNGLSNRKREGNGKICKETTTVNEEVDVIKILNFSVTGV